jgi:hypothetical protein
MPRNSNRSPPEYKSRLTLLHQPTPCVHIYIHTHIHTLHTYIYTHITYIHTYTHYIHTLHTYTHTHVTYIHTYIHTLHTYIHTYIHTGKHAHIKQAGCPVKRGISSGKLWSTSLDFR